MGILDSLKNAPQIGKAFYALKFIHIIEPLNQISQVYGGKLLLVF